MTAAVYALLRGALSLAVMIACACACRARTVAFWLAGGEFRYVAGCGRMLLVHRAARGELCTVDVQTEDGSVLRTLARGADPVDVRGDARDMKHFHADVIAIEPFPTGIDTDEAQMSAARGFLMARCGGYRRTTATATEVVRLMESAVGAQPRSFAERLRITTAEFDTRDVVGDGPVVATPVDP